MSIGGCTIASDSEADLLFAAIAASGVATLLIEPQASGAPIVRANAAFAALTGFAVEEVVGRDIGILEMAATGPGGLSRLHAAIRSGSALDLELACGRKASGHFPAALFLSPVPDPAGRTAFMLCTLFDIGPRERADRQGAGLGEAREVVRAFGHEMNNLLTIMRSNIEVLLQSPADPRSPIRLERIAWAIDSAAERVRSLGARFREAPKAEAPGSKLPRARPGERILLIEPDEVLGLQAGSMLRGLGYEVVCETGAEAALGKLAGPDAVDLLIADARLCAGNGAALARRGVKLVQSTPDAAAPPGALRKPFQLLELARLVRAAIDAAPG